MSTTVKFPRTNQELANLGGGQPVRFPGTEEEYWILLEEADYRVDFYNQEIIACMSYESDEHSAITSRINFLLQTIFQDANKVRVHNSNRPICIPFCNNAVFNPDGSAVLLPGKKYEYRPGMTAELTPLVLFEVLSGTTRVRDWGEKLPCYKQIPSLQQILYVDSERPRIAVMERLEGQDKWLEIAYEKPEDGFSVQGRQLSVQEVYKGTFAL
ncbi:MAG: Uma2 family endonuclease [Phaeodactylibacter sp.]|nr:Uma2 family endonuclease [Phaeodactylibacter sp.]